MITPSDWPNSQEQRKRAGAINLALMGDPENQIVSYWLDPNGTVVRDAVAVVHQEFPSAVPLLPEWNWAEREAHDCFGFRPVGHPDLRSLMRLSEGEALSIRRAQGTSVFEMGVGPIHAGIIESGHFRFSLVGETIVHMDLHLFHKHRGIEAFMVGQSVTDLGRLVSRLCGADSVSHQMSWAKAVEKIAGRHPGPGVQTRRIVLLESERILSHLNDLAQIPAGVGWAPAAQEGLYLKEIWQQGLEKLAGHRYLFDVIGPGWAAAIDRDTLKRLVEAVRPRWARWRIRAEHHHGFQDRMRQVGVVTPKVAEDLGAVGVVARASGISVDLRHWLPEYAGRVLPIAVDKAGDVAARFRVRLDEVEAAWDLLSRMADSNEIMEPDPVAVAIPPDLDGEAVGFVESPHGAHAHVVRVRRGEVARYHVHSGSFHNWPLVMAAVPQNAIGDFPLINKSFELCYSCNDR